MCCNRQIIVAKLAMTLDNFYASANEAVCHSTCSQTQQTNIMHFDKQPRSTVEQSESFDACMHDSNKCYHLFQHALASSLILINIVDYAAKKIVERSPNYATGVVHELSAVRLAADSRKVYSYIS